MRATELHGCIDPSDRCGLSTGWEADLRGDWEAQVSAAREFSTSWIELSALSRTELASPAGYLSSAASRELEEVAGCSLHGPAKHIASDPDRAASAEEWRKADGELAALPGLERFSGIVLHPDTAPDLSALEPIAGRVIFENMDCRKRDCRTADELERVFAALPEAGFCLDVAHAWTIDPTLEEGRRLLDRFGGRLTHVHVSGIEPNERHRPTTPADLARYAPLLERARHVPWTFESPVVAGG